MLKTLVAVPVEGLNSLFEVRYKEGGSVPLPLQGRYTSVKYAEKAIQEFLVAQNRIQGDSK